MWLPTQLYGARLSGTKRYTVTFAKDQTPPGYGFWSLTLYDAHHFFVPNDVRRYSLGTKNKDLKTNADGSLTIYVQAGSPRDAQRSNWLPAPKDADFSLFIRAYWPKVAVIDGSWTHLRSKWSREKKWGGSDGRHDQTKHPGDLGR